MRRRPLLLVIGYVLFVVLCYGFTAPRYTAMSGTICTAAGHDAAWCADFLAARRSQNQAMALLLSFFWPLAPLWWPLVSVLTPELPLYAGFHL